MTDDSRQYRWVLLMHQLPPQSSSLRVKVWRRLQRIGAVAVKNSVYVLPYREQTYEDFQWLGQEIEDAGGEVCLFKADTVGDMEDREIVQVFQAARGREYQEILTGLSDLERRLACEGGKPERTVVTELERIHRQIEEMSRIDFFDAPEKTAVLEAFRRCQRALGGESVSDETRVVVHRREVFRRRTWATRKRPHIDRVATAWLIRRFIDSEAQFVFVEEGGGIQEEWVPFDMAGVEFGHRRDDCTFETLLKAFDLAEPVLQQIGEIVHDADLKDGKFGRSEADGIEKVIRGFAASLTDLEILNVGAKVFDGLAATLSTGS